VSVLIAGALVLFLRQRLELLGQLPNLLASRSELFPVGKGLANRLASSGLLDTHRFDGRLRLPLQALEVQ
jgi:hypothetical protein